MAGYNKIRDTLGAACRASVQAKMPIYDTPPETPASPSAVVRPRVPASREPLTIARSPVRWIWEVLVFVGKVNTQAAQRRLGDLLSEDSALIDALNNVEFPGGYADVTDTGISKMRIGATMYAYAKITVAVVA